MNWRNIPDEDIQNKYFEEWMNIILEYIKENMLIWFNEQKTNLTETKVPPFIHTICENFNSLKLEIDYKLVK